jgi:hypothetical protein
LAGRSGLDMVIGMSTTTPSAEPKSNSESSKKLRGFIFAYFVPTIAGKITLLYFGLNYSYYPGEGYGYGLAASIIFTVFMLGRFIFKYWDHEEF